MNAVKSASLIGLGAVVCALGLYALYALALAEMRPVLTKEYLIELDEWASGEAPLSRMATNIVERCTHLVYVSAGPLERLRLLPADRSRFDFRVNACVTLTVSRRLSLEQSKEPSRLERDICHGSRADLFLKMICDNVGPTHSPLQRPSTP
jgi:hypothetical protein